MKKNLFALAAVVAAVSLSSYTVNRSIDYFLIYEGTGDQYQLTSYVEPYVTVQPGTDTETSGTPELNWFRITDVAEDGISLSELQARVNFFDTDDDGTLNDESDIANQLDIKLIP